MVSTMRDIARRGRRLAEHRVAGAQRRGDEGPDRGRDAGAGHRGRRELGYRPNPLARGLRGASTNLIGAVVRDFSDPFFAGRDRGAGRRVDGARLQRRARARPRPRSTRRIPLTSVLETRHTDAIVLLGDMRVQPQLLADLRSSRVPVVALWQGTSPLEFPTADTDDRAGIRAGLEHLASLGHRRIAFVSAELPGDFRVREDAYVDFMRRAVRRRARRLPRALPEHAGRRRRGPAPPAGAAGAADRGRHLDRPGRRRGRCTPRTASAPPCPSGCRSSASTTS